MLAPRAEVHLVNAHRQLKRIARRPLLNPVVIVPPEAARVPDDRRALGRLLEETPHRVGFVHHLAKRVQQLKLVKCPLPDSRHEQLPHAGVAQATHLVSLTIPVIEVADHAGPPDIRRPNSERRAVNAIYLPQLRTQFLVKHQLVPLADPVEIGIGKRRRKRFALGVHAAHAVGTTPSLARL